MNKTKEEITIKFVSKLQEQEIVRRYKEGELSSVLAKEYGYKTKKSITDIVKKYGEKTMNNSERDELLKPHRSFSVEHVDTPFKAYWLGLMITDGWIESGTIYFSSTDKDVVEFVSKNIHKDYKVIIRENRLPQYRVAFNSPKLVEQINKRGIESCKSKTKKQVVFYDDEQKYLPYFIRGVIDGDGWINKNQHEFFICSGSKDFADYIKDLLENKFYMCDVNIHKSSEMDVWYVRSGIQRNIDILKTIIYDVPFGMGRKYNILHGKISETTMTDASMCKDTRSHVEHTCIVQTTTQ